MSGMWGLNIVGIKVALAAFPPIWNAFWRLLLGWPVIWLWARLGNVPLKLARDERRPLMILGVIFAVQIMMLNTSINWTSAAYASVLLNAAPVCINVIAHFFVPGDVLSRQRVIGLVIAFGGVAVSLLGRPDSVLAPHPLLGNGLAVITAVVIGGRMVYTKHLVDTIDPIKAMFWQAAFALPVFLGCAALTEPMMVGPLTTGVLASWIYCSVGVVGIAFIVWVRLLRTNSPAMLAVFVFPTPIFGVLFSALIYGERVSAELLVGVLGVALGILLVTLERRSASPPADVETRRGPVSEPALDVPGR